MAEVIIIGKGPAGISTALYTVRAGIKTIIIGRDFGALEKAHNVENYYGFAEPVDAVSLVEAGVQQAKRLGCEVISDEVLAIGFENKLTVRTKSATYTADAVVIATGVSRNRPKISRMDEFEGKGISYCAICDAFFYKNKDVCVIGNGEYAKSEAEELIPVVGSVTILTNGKAVQADFPKTVKLDERIVASFSGDKQLDGVVFSDGETLEVNGVFIAEGTASSTDLARKIGAMIENNRIVVDKNMMTNVPSLYAVGDCIGGLLQISKAVADGAICGTAIVKATR